MKRKRTETYRRVKTEEIEICKRKKKYEESAAKEAAIVDSKC